MVKSMKETLANIRKAMESVEGPNKLRADILFLIAQFEQGLDTNMMGPDPVKVNLFYPRVDDNPEVIHITLYDVRAANSIQVRFDFDRNGWSIGSDLYDPDEKWWEKSQEELDAISEQPQVIHEVAFVDAWPLKGEPRGGTEHPPGPDVPGGGDPWPSYLVG